MILFNWLTFLKMKCSFERLIKKLPALSFIFRVIKRIIKKYLILSERAFFWSYEVWAIKSILKMSEYELWVWANKKNWVFNKSYAYEAPHTHTVSSYSKNSYSWRTLLLMAWLHVCLSNFIMSNELSFLTFFDNRFMTND
jgi:hypothetical protein